MTEETFEQTRWSLVDLLPAVEGPQFDQYLADLEVAVAELEARRDTLSPGISEESFLHLMALVEKISSLSQRLGYYGGLWFYADTQDQDALAYRGRMDKLLTDVRNRILFFELWWKGLDDEAAERLLAASGDTAYYLESLRHFASPISVRNLRNDIPDPVANTLLEVCRENAGLFQRWFRLKAGWAWTSCGATTSTLP